MATVAGAVAAAAVSAVGAAATRGEVGAGVEVCGTITGSAVEIPGKGTVAPETAMQSGKQSKCGLALQKKQMC